METETRDYAAMARKQAPAARSLALWHTPGRPGDCSACSLTPETLERAFDRLQGYNREAMRSLPEAPKMLPVARVFATVATQAAEALR